MIHHNRGAVPRKCAFALLQVTGNARKNKYLTPRGKDAKINLFVIKE